MFFRRNPLGEQRLATIALFAASAAITVASCSEERFQSFARPLGGHDAEDAGDQIYFHTAFCEGHPTRLAALFLPADWPERARVPSPDGGLARLEPPVVPHWVHGDGIAPRVRLELISAEGVQYYALQPSEGLKLFPTWMFRDPRADEDVDARAFERLLAGSNAYRVVPVEADASHAPHRVLGAVLDGDGGVEWVELAVVEFWDGRSALTRLGHSVARGAGEAIELTAYVAAIGGGLWLTVVFFEWAIDELDGDRERGLN